MSAVPRPASIVTCPSRVVVYVESDPFPPLARVMENIRGVVTRAEARLRASRVLREAEERAPIDREIN